MGEDHALEDGVGAMGQPRGHRLLLEGRQKFVDARLQVGPQLPPGVRGTAGREQRRFEEAFGDADGVQPGVTVVAQDAAALGRTAAERLFRQLDGTLVTPERIELPTRLITRGSGELPPAD